MEQMGQNQGRRACFVQIARWQHLGRSLPSLTDLVVAADLCFFQYYYFYIFLLSMYMRVQPE